MAQITPADVPRVAAVVRLAGELLEMHGALMLTLTGDWAAGAKAANLDPTTRGNRWDVDRDTGEVSPVPSDPTGEAVVAQRRADLAGELQTRLARLIEDAQWVRDTAHVLAPIVPPSTMNAKDDLWCAHHLKVGLCEIRHRNDLCRWCSDFMALWSVRPPVGLLRDRHDGKRITETMVKAALEADGLILKSVGGVTKAIRAARPRNQNEKKKAG